MSELVYYVAISIDGRIAATDGSVSGFIETPEYLDELHRTYADALPGPAQVALGIRPPLSQWDAVVMGRRTYDIGLEQGVTDPYPHLDQYVVSRSIDEKTTGDVTVVRDDPVGLVRELKAKDGVGIWLCGGGELASALVDEIDRLVLKVNPVVLGEGVPLFGRVAAPVRWKSIASRTFPAGVTILEYSRA